MKRLEYMLCHALVTAEEPNARVAFVFDSGVQAREAFARLQEAAKCVSGYVVDTRRQQLRSERGGVLQVHWATQENTGDFAGCQWSHMYHVHGDATVIQFLKCRVRASYADYKTPPGIYTKYGAEVITDY